MKKREERMEREGEKSERKVEEGDVGEESRGGRLEENEEKER